MPATDEDLDIKTPGAAQVVEPTALDADPKDARIAELEALVAQLQAGRAAEPLPAKDETAGSRLIGEDWSTKTVAEVQAAGVDDKVLTKEGYYIPSDKG